MTPEPSADEPTVPDAESRDSRARVVPSDRDRPIDEVVERPALLRLGAEVGRLRVAAGLTQSQLAERCRLSPSQVSRIERGQTRTRYSTLKRLATVLAPGTVRETTDHLADLAGEALAAESRRASRQQRRDLNQLPTAIAAAREAKSVSVELVARARRPGSIIDPDQAAELADRIAACTADLERQQAEVRADMRANRRRR